MTKKLSSFLYKIILFLVKLFYPKIKVYGAENLPSEPCIIAANHTQMNGPICAEIYFPRKRYTWCAGEMMHLKEVPAYAFGDFWAQKPKYTHPFYKMLSFIIAPLSVIVFNNAKTIGVYKDKRIMHTFKETLKRLYEGNDIVIFPEQDIKHNHILYDFQEGFVDIAKIYYKRYGKELSFVPMYIAPKLKKVYLGKPIKFSAEAPLEGEMERISEYLMDEITKIAESLPLHTVVPYRNIPKRNYPKNKPEGADRI
jgi:1-acyl-sn-glycerol-3-phosphate acyltransferase